MIMATTMRPIMNSDTISDSALLRLLQLVSPSLPVGSFAYSQGLEWAIEAGWVHDSNSTADWLLGQMQITIGYVDVPLLTRACAAAGSRTLLEKWDNWVFACRETAELRAEEHHRGQALIRLLVGLDIEQAAEWQARSHVSFITAFAIAVRTWAIPVPQAASGYVWSWLENQILAAVKLVPLGQLAGQKLLGKLAAEIPTTVSGGLSCDDSAIGACTPGLAIASCRHEEQYTRLFRS